jgi:FAD/FMN-containing dehydrogenase
VSDPVAAPATSHPLRTARVRSDTAHMEQRPDVIETLIATFGADSVLTGDTIAAYERDWTGRWTGAARAVVRPRTAAEAATLVQLARHYGVALVPRGGGTGLVGGAVPSPDATDIMVCTTRMREIAIDPVAGTAVVGAGVTLAELNSAAAPYGLRFAVDLGSRDSATLAGMIATNAGGLRMLRWGDTAAQLLGIEVVTGHGDILTHLRGLTKDNVGLRWHQLLAGSEGTLGIICRAVVRLVPIPAAVAWAWFPVADAAAAVAVASIARRQAHTSAVEYVHPDGIALVAALSNRTPPTTGPAVIVEAAADDPVAALAALAGILDADDAVLADGPSGRELWAWRDRHTEAIATAGIPAKCDVAVPLRHWAAFHDAVPAALADIDPALYPIRFGHIADGNVHVNILRHDRHPPQPEADDAIWRLAASFGGTISAEHGIGIAKAPWLNLSRTPAELVAIERLRRSWDPDNICSPRTARVPE